MSAFVYMYVKVWQNVGGRLWFSRPHSVALTTATTITTEWLYIKRIGGFCVWCRSVRGSAVCTAVCYKCAEANVRRTNRVEGFSGVPEVYIPKLSWLGHFILLYTEKLSTRRRPVRICSKPYPRPLPPHHHHQLYNDHHVAIHTATKSVIFACVAIRRLCALCTCWSVLEFLSAPLRVAGVVICARIYVI